MTYDYSFLGWTCVQAPDRSSLFNAPGVRRITLATRVASASIVLASVAQVKLLFCSFYIAPGSAVSPSLLASGMSDANQPRVRIALPQQIACQLRTGTNLWDSHTAARRAELPRISRASARSG